jgi:hypothetical protein
MEIGDRDAPRVQPGDHLVEAVEDLGGSRASREVGQRNRVDPAGGERERAETPQEGREPRCVSRPQVGAALASDEQAAEGVPHEERPRAVVLERDAPPAQLVERNVGLRQIPSGQSQLGGEADESLPDRFESTSLCYTRPRSESP